MRSAGCPIDARNLSGIKSAGAGARGGVRVRSRVGGEVRRRIRVAAVARKKAVVEVTRVVVVVKRKAKAVVDEETVASKVAAIDAAINTSMLRLLLRGMLEECASW